AEGFKTNHLLFPMGEDFAFDRAISWFKNMDKLIHYVNLVSRSLCGWHGMGGTISLGGSLDASWHAVGWDGVARHIVVQEH
ncbi:unnamed protein product, partial [Closterium sp. NIES-54]